MIMKIEYKWCCKYCEYIGKSRRELQKHHKEIHNFTRYNFPVWNKGLTKENDERINKLSKKLSIIFTGISTHPQTEETRQKISATAKKNGKSGGYRQGAGYKNIKKGFYKGYWCDSSWELAFLIYCLEHNITIKRNTDKFPYYMENKLYYYIPDFIIGNTYIEIKGRVDSKCKYKFEQFPDKQRLKIYYAKDMKYFLDYVYKKYGKNFIDLYDDKVYVKKEKNIRNHEYYCKYCNDKFDTRHLLSEHLKLCKKHAEHKKNKKQEYRILKNKENELNNVPKDITGRYNHSIISENIWLERKEKILSCGVDLMKFGWVGKVKQLTGLTQRELENTLIHFKEEFEGKYFRRK